jgi:hypothetical protein
MRSRIRQRATQSAHRRYQREHPEEFVCACNNQGFVFKSGEVVCKRCHEAEMEMWTTKGELRGYARREMVTA